MKNLVRKETAHGHIYNIYMYKQDLALNNLQGLVCHKTQTNQQTLREWVRLLLHDNLRKPFLSSFACIL